MLEFVKTQTRQSWVELQIEGSHFDSFLLVAIKAGEAVGKGIGNAKFHGFIKISPTLTLPASGEGILSPPRLRGGLGWGLVTKL